MFEYGASAFTRKSEGVMLQPELVDFCEGNACAALILQSLGDWAILCCELPLEERDWRFSEMYFYNTFRKAFTEENIHESLIYLHNKNAIHLENTSVTKAGDTSHLIHVNFKMINNYIDNWKWSVLPNYN